MMSTAFGIHNSQILLRYAYCIWRTSRTTSSWLCSDVYTRAHPVHMENAWMLLRALVLACNTYIVIYTQRNALVFCVDVEPCQTFFLPSSSFVRDCIWTAEKTVLAITFQTLKAIRSSADRTECWFSLFRIASALNKFCLTCAEIKLNQLKKLEEESYKRD